MRSRIAAGLLVTACVWFAVACGNDDDSDPSPTPPNATPTEAPATREPAATATPKTANAAIAAIIAAAEANEVANLAGLIRYRPTACATNVQGAGGPPDCRPDEVDGTLVDVLAISDCEGHFVREDELALDPIATGTVTFVDAFAAPQEFFPGADTVLVFTRLMSGIGEIGWELALADEAIVAIKYGCGDTAQELISLQELGNPIVVE